MPITLPSYKDCEYLAWSQLTQAQKKEADIEFPRQRPPEQYHYLIHRLSGRVLYVYPKHETPQKLKEYERQYWGGSTS